MPLNGQQWLICIVLAVAVLLVTEVVKFFLRRSRGRSETGAEAPATVLAQTPA
jgi:hypothetical protein